MFRWRWIVGLILVSVAITMGWLFQTSRGLGVGGQWLIIPNGWWPAGAWGLPLVALFLFGGLSALSAYDCFVRAKSPREARQSATLSIGALTLFALLWPWFLLGPGGTGNLVSSSFSDVSNQYFSAAWQIKNVRDFTRDYAKTQQNPQSLMLAHVATHPPGAVLFYEGARGAYENVPLLQSIFEGFARWQASDDLASLALSANAARGTAARSAGVSQTPADLPLAAVGGAIWSAFLLSLAVAFSVPAVYGLASMRLDSRGLAPMGDDENLAARRARGMVAAALFATAPAVGLFTFTIDALIAAGTLWALLCLARGFAANGRRKKLLWLLLCGALTMLLCFISFGALALLAIIGLAWLFHRQKSWRQLAALFAGFVAMLIVLQVIFPMQLPLIFHQAMAAHRFATLQSRTWHLWVWINVIVFALFCGWPLWWLGIFDFLKTIRGRAALKELSVAGQIGVATVLVMLLLTLSGGARGEVERLWLFLIAPLAVLAGQRLIRTRREVYLVAVLLALQCVQTLLMAAALAPLVRPF